MATTYTENFDLGKQLDKTDKFDMSVITDNVDKIDMALANCVKIVDNQTVEGVKTFVENIVANITGNADTATKATQDTLGNTITSTYIKSIAKSDDYGTLTATKGDGTTFDFKANAVINQNHATGTASRPLMLANRLITDSTISYESHLSYCNNAVYVKPSTGTLTATQFSGTMADYAEMFEWADGNTSKVDRRGLFVTISNGEKISLADDTNDILGIVSANPLLLGDNPENEWNGKYKKDIFGAYLFDTNGDKILSDEYNELQEYAGRENRPEWSAIGLMGKLVMIDDGTCQVGWYCKPCSDSSGRATYSIEVTRCKVIKRIDDTHIKVFFH